MKKNRLFKPFKLDKSVVSLFLGGFALLLYILSAVQKYRWAHSYNELVRFGELVDAPQGRYFTISNLPQRPARPKVIMLPGLSGLAFDWEPLLKGLQTSCPAIVIDRAGYGLTTVPGGAGTPLAIADEMLNWPEIFGLEKPFVLVAHSFTGLPALLFASRHPELVKSLVLLDPSTPGNFSRYPEPVNLSQRHQLRRYRIASVLSFSGLPNIFHILGNPGNAMHPEISQEYNQLFYSHPTIHQATKEYENFEANDSEFSNIQLPSSLPVHLFLAGQTLGNYRKEGWLLQRNMLAKSASVQVFEEVNAQHEDFIVNPKFNTQTTQVIESACTK